MFTKIKASVQVPTLVVLRYQCLYASQLAGHWTISLLLFMKQVTVCIQAILVKLSLCLRRLLIFLAEIASTTNENILTEKLLEEVEDDATRFAILNNFLDGFRGTVFRQTQFAEFEHAIHQADQNGRS